MKRLVGVVLLIGMVALAGCGTKRAEPTKAPAEPAVATPADPTPSGTVAATPVDPPQPQTQVEAPNPAPPPAVDGVEGFYPGGTPTGVAVVDRFLEAVRTGKTAAYLDQYQPVALPCVVKPGLGGPLCPEGTPSGTVVQAYAYAWCNLAYLTNQAEWHRYMEGVFRSGTNLFAVYRAAAVPGLKQGPAYGVVMGGSLVDYSAPTLYLGEDGNLLLARWGCGLPIYGVPPGAAVILAPKVTPTAAERAEAEAGLTGVVASEVQQGHLFLQVALGELDPCKDAKDPCIMEKDFGQVVTGVIGRCDKVGADAQVGAYVYNEERQGPVFRPYAEACRTLIQAEVALGQPKDTPQWRAAALKARQLLGLAAQALSKSK